MHDRIFWRRKYFSKGAFLIRLFLPWAHNHEFEARCPGRAIVAAEENACIPRLFPMMDRKRLSTRNFLAFGI
jgi:hypothetical protein